MTSISSAKFLLAIVSFRGLQLITNPWLYRQNEKYFKDIASYIKEQFTFPEFKDEYNKTTYEKIKNCENAVFIHVRRSDYKACDQLDISFYQQAVKYIQEKVENPTFFVFGA